ncbi:MAG: hypothetical protein QXF17_06650 [Ignisphaera sp.]
MSYSLQDPENTNDVRLSITYKYDTVAIEEDKIPLNEVDEMFAKEVEEVISFTPLEIFEEVKELDTPVPTPLKITLSGNIYIRHITVYEGPADNVEVSVNGSVCITGDDGVFGPITVRENVMEISFDLPEKYTHPYMEHRYVPYFTKYSTKTAKMLSISYSVSDRRTPTVSIIVELAPYHGDIKLTSRSTVIGEFNYWGNLTLGEWRAIKDMFLDGDVIVFDPEINVDTAEGLKELLDKKMVKIVILIDMQPYYRRSTGMFYNLFYTVSNFSYSTMLPNILSSCAAFWFAGLNMETCLDYAVINSDKVSGVIPWFINLTNYNYSLGFKYFNKGHIIEVPYDNMWKNEEYLIRHATFMPCSTSGFPKRRIFWFGNIYPGSGCSGYHTDSNVIWLASRVWPRETTYYISSF